MFIFRYPTIHIIPFISELSYKTSTLTENILKLDNFKGEINSHSLCKRLVNIGLVKKKKIKFYLYFIYLAPMSFWN